MEIEFGLLQISTEQNIISGFFRIISFIRILQFDIISLFLDQNKTGHF